MTKIIQADTLSKDRYERSKRLGWFSLEKVRKTKVLVVGAGALGNEVCKNLALSGFGNITIVDMDYIVTSNLNRCIFFSERDAERRRYKARVVAQKLKKIEPNVKVKAFVKKIQDFPEDFIPSHNIVLGCLDNVLARLHVNAHCYAHRIPYIDGATDGLKGKVQVVIAPETSCLECGMNKTHKKISNIRFSCTGKDVMVFERKIAADINTTSIISAIQVQEALKIAHERWENVIKNIFYYDGERIISQILELPINPKCMHHGR